jgi:hypothetical protein
MEGQKILNIFVKAENKLQASFNQLPLASPQEQGLGLSQIQQTSYFLEKLNQPLFHKIVKDCKNQLESLRSKYPQIRQAHSCSVNGQGLKFVIDQKEMIAPLLTIPQALKLMKIKDLNYSGKFVQISYILRTENYLDLCLISLLTGGKNE